jgi:hypothetical protein
LAGKFKLTWLELWIWFQLLVVIVVIIRILLIKLACSSRVAKLLHWEERKRNGGIRVSLVATSCGKERPPQQIEASDGRQHSAADLSCYTAMSIAAGAIIMAFKPGVNVSCAK